MICIKEVFCSSIDVEKMPNLGFGLIRLPMKEEEIDIEAVSRMVDEYMSAGLKY
jgi:predicted aldo/keto reductase-like oxidoreductase